MASSVSSPVSSGGYGSDFERDVVTWMALNMLRDRPLFTTESWLIHRINVQTRVDGWVLDDVELQGPGDGNQGSVLVSVKSHPGFGVQSWPADILASLWSQYLGLGGRVFDSERDCLCLIVGDLAEPIYQSLRSLLRLARDCDQATFVQRMEQESGFCSAQTRDFWNASTCPIDDVSTSKADQARLLSRLRLIRLDFREDHSASKAEALTLCRESLVAPSQTDEHRLWLEVRHLVCEIEPVSGGLTRPKILAKLRSHFQLRAAPYFEEDFSRIDRDSRLRQDQMRQHTGPQHVILSRESLMGDLSAKLRSSQVLFVTGQSGTGKSAICARLQLEFCWWLSADQLDVSGFSAFEASIGLVNRLDRLLPSMPKQQAVICIDGLDRVQADDDRVWQIFTSLARMISSTEIRGVWKMVVPVQASAMQRIVELLRSSDLDLVLDAVEVPSWNDSEWEELTHRYSWLAEAAQRSGAVSFFRLPKVADWLVNRGATAFREGTAQGQTLVARFWRELILKAGNPSLLMMRQRELLLVRLSTALADQGTRSLPVQDLQATELEAAQSLDEADILQIVNDRISFRHDLAADWSRVIFLGQEEDVVGCLFQREAFPGWHRAVRLWSAALLDAGDAAFNSWIATLEGLLGRKAVRAADLWVEGMIHTENFSSVLDRLSDRADFDTLINRFLHVFLLSGTAPSPLDPAFSRQGFSQEVLDALTQGRRQPVGTGWGRLFGYLRHNVRELSHETGILLCELGKIWLTSRLRRSCEPETTASVTDAVLSLAERFLEEGLLMFKPDEVIVEAAGDSFDSCPERVRALFRKLAGLDARSERPISRDLPQSLLRSSRLSNSTESLKPWPGGATHRASPIFAKACLSGGALMHAASHDPDFVLEILYALLIENAQERAERKTDRNDRIADDFFPKCGLSLEGRMLYPPDILVVSLLSWTHPEALVRFAIRLVEFVCDRWHEEFIPSLTRQDFLILPASPSGRAWRSFSMLQRFASLNLPQPVDLVLKAVLKSWLHRQAGKADISAEIQTVLSQSTCCGFLDVLVELGVRQPALLAGPLLDIATCPILCQRHPKLMKALMDLVGVRPEVSEAVNSSEVWWGQESELRGWGSESTQRWSKWRKLALAAPTTVSATEWANFFGEEDPDAISVENCLVHLRDPRQLLLRSLADDSRDALIDRLSPLSSMDNDAREKEDTHNINAEAKRVAAASLLVTASLGTTAVPRETLTRCRELILPYAQKCSTFPNGLITHMNYGIFGQMNYQRQEALPPGLAAYGLVVCVVRLADDSDVRLAYARTMFAREIIYTDMMWKTIRVLAEKLGGDYSRSIHLVLRVAAIREGTREMGGFGRGTSRIKAAVETKANARIEQLCQDFSSGSLSTNIPRWTDVVIEECDPIRKLWDEVREPWQQDHGRGFDTHLLDHTQPRVIHLADGSVCNAFIAWWSGCSSYIHDCETTEADGTTNERWSQHHFGQWVHTLADACVIIGDAATTEDLWHPIVSLAQSKPKNVTDFLNYWWQAAHNRSLSESVVAAFVQCFVSVLRPLQPIVESNNGYEAAALWISALGVQDEFHTLTQRSATVRCPPEILADFAPALVKTHRDYPIRSLASYASLGFSGIEDIDVIEWMEEAVLPGSYLSTHQGTAAALLRLLAAAHRRNPSVARTQPFLRLLNVLAATPWPDALRLQEALALGAD